MLNDLKEEESSILKMKNNNFKSENLRHIKAQIVSIRQIDRSVKDILSEEAKFNAT